MDIFPLKMHGIHFGHVRYSGVLNIAKFLQNPVRSLVSRPSSPSIPLMINFWRKIERINAYACINYYRGITKRKVGEEGLGTRLYYCNVPKSFEHLAKYRRIITFASLANFYRTVKSVFTQIILYIE